jgi:hypothetical protein
LSGCHGSTTEPSDKIMENTMRSIMENVTIHSEGSTVTRSLRRHWTLGQVEVEKELNGRRNDYVDCSTTFISNFPPRMNYLFTC